jgi:carboxyl-terminal processing protease
MRSFRGLLSELSEDLGVRSSKSSFWVGSLLALASSVLVSPAALAQAAGQPASQVAVAAPTKSMNDWAANLWAAAKAGDKQGFEKLLASLPADVATANAPLADSVARLREHYAWRESERARRADEVRQEMTKALAEDKGVASLSKALISAMELTDLVSDKAAVLKEPLVADLITKADAAAQDAEREGKWLTASELMLRLHLMLEETPKGQFYKDAAERVGHRLNMLRMYSPKRLWELQNERRLASDGKPLPPYNALGDDFKEKLVGVTEEVVRAALTRSAEAHVDLADWKRVILGGIDGVRTLLTTSDLREIFPGLGAEIDRQAMLTVLDEEQAKIEADKDVGAADLDRVIRRLGNANQSSVKIPTAAMLYEFGNGGMGSLDEFSAIVWPHEVSRFNKMIAGSFAGVGVHIEFDEASNVRVVSPLEGTPAHKAGIKADDVISKVDGKSVYGLPIDGVVDLITGKAGTPVNVTVERKIAPEGGGDPLKVEKEFALKRARIEVPSVKGWKRTGEKETDWDFFVDSAAKIAYIRVSGFTDFTGKEVAQAATEAKKQGAKGLVLDLRFNPGGLLDQGIRVAQAWVNSGQIVLTQGPGEPAEIAGKGANIAVLDDMPTVVLVNRGSASASEIVAGALQFYGNKGDVPVVVLGQRSYGKGSVQQVYDLPGRKSRLKLTSQYYLLPDMRIIHRRPGADIWGVDPNLEVEMLPKQIGDSITLRKNADVLPEPGSKPVDPNDLLAKNLDLQLEAALVLLEAQSYGGGVRQANASK